MSNGTAVQYVLGKPGEKNSFYFLNMSHQYDIGDNIFVFGSNEAGYHGAGAAKEAKEKYGAIFGIAFGVQGRSFGVCTKNRRLESLPIEDVHNYIKKFVQYTQDHPELSFYVTPVGTGYAGFKDDVIAPLFKGACNCWLPHLWQKFLG